MSVSTFTENEPPDGNKPSENLEVEEALLAQLAARNKGLVHYESRLDIAILIRTE